MRKEYAKQSLDESNIPSSGHPMDLFKEWFDHAVETRMDTQIEEPNAMCLATSNKEGRISSRMVLLKDYDKDGIVWYTNYKSRKG